MFELAGRAQHRLFGQAVLSLSIHGPCSHLACSAFHAAANIVLITLLSLPANAQPIRPCAPLQDQLEGLRVKHAEFLTARATNTIGQQIIWTAGHSGSWTQMIVDEKGLACIVHAGHGFSLNQGT